MQIAAKEAEDVSGHSDIPAAIDDAEIDKLQRYYGLVIRNSTDSINSMNRAIWATYFHKAITNAYPQHGLCPTNEDTWRTRCIHMKNTAKGYCCMGSVIEIRERRQDLMPLNFPVEDIHLILQLPVLFNACIELGVVIDVFPYLVPHLQRIPTEDVLGSGSS
ncbi:uncharacterized protein TNCV_3450861 [Trichonephila clavipes]|uniref:Uncharacterized protein n=1 Tax=Trichonephila clavipes TaxID=2585209 RepID=A0A8X6WJS8_TRICX|nr:uncharacterized protein TNCV_3450861 [Trichonephila clavipes]